MNKRLLTIAFLFLAAAANAETDLGVKLTLLPRSTTLPAIPVAFRVELTNRSKHSVTIPNAFALRVSTDGGEIFLARASAEGFIGAFAKENEIEAREITIEPGTQEFLFDFKSPIESPPWFLDERLNEPGHYQLQLIVSPLVTAGSTQPAVTGLAASNEVVLEVERPRGDNDAVWRRLTEQSNAHWSLEHWRANGHAMAKWIWDNYPKSSYAPMVAGLVPGKAEDLLPLWDAAIAADRDGYVTEWLKLGKPGLHERAIERAIARKDSDLALREMDAARRGYQDLLNGKNRNVRDAARKKLDSLWTPQDIHEAIRERNLHDQRRKASDESSSN